MELSHTLEVRPNRFIRAFLKFYGMKPPYDLNTCKLFWGTLGMVVIPPILLAFSPILAIIFGLAWADDKVKYAQAQKNASRPPAPLAKPTKERSRSKALEDFSAWAGRVWFRIQTPVTWLFRIVVGLLVLAGLAGIVVLLVNAPWGGILPVLWKVLVAAIIIAGIGYLALKAYVNWKVSRPAKPAKPKRPSVVKATLRSIHDHTCANIEVKS